MVTKIEITFPVDVELSDANVRLLDRAAGRICSEYVKANPGRVMWPFGQGQKMLVDPMKLSDDEPIPFDEATYHIECVEREAIGDAAEPFHLNFDSHPAEEMFHDIADFHRKFALEYKGPPRTLPLDLDAFRSAFLAEELAEYITTDKFLQSDIVVACQKALNSSLGKEGRSPSLEKQFDALIDLCYVAMGTAYLQGFAFDEGWRRVHEANMKKVRAADASHSARGSVHDVVKPPSWTAPDLSDLVRD